MGRCAILGRMTDDELVNALMHRIETCRLSFVLHETAVRCKSDRSCLAGFKDNSGVSYLLDEENALEVVAGILESIEKRHKE
jgi:hypothetical protein